TQFDAIEYIPCEPLDGILFGLCYNTMPHHLAVLHHAWKQLRPGGRVVIMDGKLPSGLGGKLLLPFSLWLMKRTMLGNPFIKPWNDLAAIADTFEMEELLLRVLGNEILPPADGRGRRRDGTAHRSGVTMPG